MHCRDNSSHLNKSSEHSHMKSPATTIRVICFFFLLPMFFSVSISIADEWFEIGGEQVLLYKYINSWNDCLENRSAAENLEKDPGESDDEFDKRKNKALESFPPCDDYCGNIVTYVTRGAVVDFLPITKKARLSFYWSDLAYFPEQRSRFSCRDEDGNEEAEVVFEEIERVYLLMPITGPGFASSIKRKGPSLRMELTAMTGGVTGKGVLFCDPLYCEGLMNTGCGGYFADGPDKAHAYYRPKRKPAGLDNKDKDGENKKRSKPSCLPPSIVVTDEDTGDVLLKCLQ